MRSRRLLLLAPLLPVAACAYGASRWRPMARARLVRHEIARVPELMGRGRGALAMNMQDGCLKAVLRP